MEQTIGILALDQIISENGNNDLYEELRKKLPSGVEILNYKSSGFELLDFIDNHKRLILLNQKGRGYTQQLDYGEVEFWGYCTGGMPEDILVMSLETLQESLAQRDSWFNPRNN